MHELSIARNIIKTVLQNTRMDGLQTVKSVKLNLGDLTGIAPESLAFCFDLASRGTAVQGSKLKVEMMPGNELLVVEVELEDQLL